MKKNFTVLCFILFYTLGGFAYEQTDNVSGEIIVRFKPDFNLHRKENLHHIRLQMSPFAILKFRPLLTDATLVLMKIAEDKDLPAAISRLETMSEVEFAEPNYILHAFGNKNISIPNDPLFEKNWGLYNFGQINQSNIVGKIGADINVLDLWNMGVVGSNKIIVAVIDSGVDWDHEDLRANIYTNPGEAGVLASNGIDDDHNGFIDDVHGWNFEAKNNNSADDFYHGTHCAGILGAVGNNGIGISGVNWNVSILPIKFLNKDGSGSTVDAVEGINYALKMGAKVLSNSWGGKKSSKALQQAIEKANTANVLFVAAAGNDSSNSDLYKTYPANYDVANVISVAASTSRDTIARFSNYGMNRVHVAAPGFEIYSTMPKNNYGYANGTSMAAPHVAGIAALLLSKIPNLTVTEIKERLIKTSTPLYELNHYVMAHGRVNAKNALYNVITEPQKPKDSDWKDFAFTLESPHPYKKDTDFHHELRIPNAKMIRLVFEKIALEKNRDFLIIEDGDSVMVNELTGEVVNFYSEYVKGEVLNLFMNSNGNNQYFGFKVIKAQYIE